MMGSIHFRTRGSFRKKHFSPPNVFHQARVAEQADAADSKSAGGDTIGVRFPSRVPMPKSKIKNIV